MGNQPNTRCARCGEVVLTLSTAAELLAEVCRAHRERVGIPEGPPMPGVELERVEAHGGYRDAATPARVEVRFVVEKSESRMATAGPRSSGFLIGGGVVVLVVGMILGSESSCGVSILLCALLAIAVLPFALLVLLPSKRARPIAALTRVDGRGDILVAHGRRGERAVPAHQVGLGTRETTVQGDRPSWALWLRVGAETYRLTAKHGVEEDVLRTQLILEDALGLETSERLAPALAERLGS